MIEKLKEIQKNSYSPYSHFPVSAILITKDGKEFPGVNVENASYGAGICAERSAILSAISRGYTKKDFQELYVLTPSKKIGTPCFECRQVLSELLEKDVVVHCCSLEGEMKDYTIEELCPYPFGEDDLA